MQGSNQGTACFVIEHWYYVFSGNYLNGGKSFSCQQASIQCRVGQGHKGASLVSMALELGDARHTRQPESCLHSSLDLCS
jgi:hypothetical protein